jgi:hypothetical protein
MPDGKVVIISRPTIVMLENEWVQIVEKDFDGRLLMELKIRAQKAK